MAILDTDILVALLKGSPDAMKKVGELEEKTECVATTIITAYELMKGAYLSARPQENLAKVKDIISNLQVLDLSAKACEEAAQIYIDLKKSGNLIGEFDILIVGIARAYDETIVTRDAHFQAISGLKVINW